MHSCGNASQGHGDETQSDGKAERRRAKHQNGTGQTGRASAWQSTGSTAMADHCATARQRSPSMRRRRTTRFGKAAALLCSARHGIAAARNCNAVAKQSFARRGEGMAMRDAAPQRHSSAPPRMGMARHGSGIAWLGTAWLRQSKAPHGSAAAWHRWASRRKGIARPCMAVARHGITRQRHGEALGARQCHGNAARRYAALCQGIAEQGKRSDSHRGGDWRTV